MAKSSPNKGNKIKPSSGSPTYTPGTNTLQDKPFTPNAGTLAPDWMKKEAGVIDDPNGDIPPAGYDYTGVPIGGGDTDYSNLYDTTLNNYQDDQSRQSLNSLRSAFAQNRADLYAQRPTIQQDAQEMRNAADTDYYTNDLQQLRRAMEAGGQKGGENITGMVSANATRGQRMGNADLYEKNQLRNIDNAVANLGSQESQALAEAQMGINSNVLTNRLAGIRDAMNLAQTQRANEKADYLNSIGAYADDFMKEINNLKAQGYSDNSYQIKALLDARNRKIANQNASAADQAQQDLENQIKLTQLNYNINKPYYNPNSGDSTMSYDEALKRYQSGDQSYAVLKRLNLL